MFFFMLSFFFKKLITEIVHRFRLLWDELNTFYLFIYLLTYLLPPSPFLTPALANCSPLSLKRIKLCVLTHSISYKLRGSHCNAFLPFPLMDMWNIISYLELYNTQSNSLCSYTLINLIGIFHMEQMQCWTPKEHHRD